jgi:sigma-B regulation protein RsbU (phosphoserine phosphatase)
MKTGTWTHSERPRRAASERQTIGLVVDSVADGYQRILFESIARATRDQGVNLIVFAGGPLPSPLYDLIDRRNVDAVIVVGSTIAHQVGPERLAAFCKRLPSVPVCSIGVPVDSIPSLVPVATPGVIAVVTHLMTEHGRRRLAFIRGLGADGAERFEAFRTCLNEFGVPFREELVVDGTYVMESGREAIRILCDERRVSFDGVVAANDYMALGAIEALEERGFTVPKDVAVVGFDDIEDARNALVPLTTVQQPIRELGKRAVLVCLKLLAQRPLGEVGPITCRPVKRRSCGCVVETPYTRRPSDLAQHFSSTEAALMARRELVLSDMLRTAQEELGDVGYHWEERLFNAIVEELQSGAGSPFLSANEELSRRVFRSSGDVSTWQRVLLALRFHVLECIEDDHALRSAAEDAFNNAFLVSASVVAREEHSRRSGLEQLLRGVIRTSNALVTWMQSGWAAATCLCTRMRAATARTWCSATTGICPCAGSRSRGCSPRANWCRPICFPPRAAPSTYLSR